MKKRFCALLILMFFLCGCMKRLPGLEERFQTDDFIKGYDLSGQFERNMMDQYQEKIIYREGNWIYVYDQSTDICEKLCHKPGCNHEGAECNAYNEVRFYGSGLLQIYDGEVYLIGELENQWALYKMDLNGKEKELVQKLPVEISVMSVITFIHRGYVFTYAMEYKKTRMYQSVLGQEGEDVQIWKELGDNGSYFCTAGNKVYRMSYSTGETSDVELTEYDLTRNEWIALSKTSVEGLVGPLWVINRKIYVGNHSLIDDGYKILSYDLEKEEWESVSLNTKDVNANNISMFSSCVVVFEHGGENGDKKSCQIFDYTGKEINAKQLEFPSFPVEKTWYARLFCLGEMDGELLFQYVLWYDESDVHYLYDRLPM